MKTHEWFYYGLLNTPIINIFALSLAPMYSAELMIKRRIELGLSREEAYAILETIKLNDQELKRFSKVINKADGKSK